MEKISVCLASYNGEKYLKEQLESIIVQLPENGEIIISDDGSTDATKNIVESFKDSRIRFIHNQKRHGVIPNFENALSKATGGYLFLSDQDDIWLPGKIAEITPCLKTALLVVHDCSLVDANKKEIHGSFFKVRNSGPGFIKNLWKNSYLGCCMAFRKELLNSALPVPKTIHCHDVWFGLLAEKISGVFFLNKVLSMYRRHGNNESPTGEGSDTTLLEKIRRRYFLLFHALVRIRKNNKKTKQ